MTHAAGPDGLFRPPFRDKPVLLGMGVGADGTYIDEPLNAGHRGRFHLAHRALIVDLPEGPALALVLDWAVWELDAVDDGLHVGEGRPQALSVPHVALARLDRQVGESPAYRGLIAAQHGDLLASAGQLAHHSCAGQARAARYQDHVRLLRPPLSHSRGAKWQCKQYHIDL